MWKFNRWVGAYMHSVRLTDYATEAVIEDIQVRYHKTLYTCTC